MNSLPAFEFPDAAAWLILSRGLFVTLLVLTYGTPLFRSRLAGGALRTLPQASATALTQQYRRLGLGTASGAVLAAFFWLLVQTRAIADTHGVPQLLAEAPQVLFATSFGHTLLLQIVALLGGIAVLALRKPTAETFAFAAFFAGCALVGQGWQGHAAAMYDGFSPLLLSEIAHLLAAGAWLGSLPPLLILLRAAPPQAGAIAARRFAPFGSRCVAVLAVTAFLQGRALIGSVPGLLGTEYGLIALLKIALFLALLGFAAFNRFRLTPRLSQPGASRARLVRSVALETGFGLAILVAASTLLTLPPAMHEQPLWPFARQFSLATISEDAGFRAEVVNACLDLVAALCLFVAAIFLRRLRYPMLIAGGAIAWFAIPHLDLLLVEAHPTSFYHSTTGFSTSAIAAGAVLYPRNCAECHGPQGRGDGSIASDLGVPPADLTAPHLWMHSDGELFWWLTDGIADPDGKSPDERVMPSFAATLSEEQRWQLIDFIRARNAGLAVAATGQWPMPVQAPGFPLQCQGQPATGLDSLRGSAVLLVFGDGAVPVMEGGANSLVTVRVAQNARADAASCAATDPQIAMAYAIVSGIPVDKISHGAMVLIDPNGWLRAIQPPGGTEWATPAALLAKVQEICNHPLAESESAHAHHHHH